MHSDPDERDSVSVEREHLADVLEALPVGVFILDASGKAIYENSAAQALLGREIGDDDHARNLSSRFPTYRQGADGIYPSDELPIVRALAGQRATADDLVIDRGDGRRVALEVTATPILNAGGRVLFAVAVFQDITARREAQRAVAALNQELELAVERRTLELARTVSALEEEIHTRRGYEQELLQARDEAERASRAKSVFLMNMSHELRTPLNHIIGFSDLLTERLDDLKMRKLAETTNTSGRELLEKVNDLIELARAEAEPASTESAPIDCDALLRSVAAEAGVRCDIPIPLGIFSGDLEAVRQILTDVLQRAPAPLDSGELVVSATKDHHTGSARLVVRIPSKRLASRISALSSFFNDAPWLARNQYQQQEIDLRLAVARAHARVLGGDLAAGNEAAYITLPFG
jgi:signal transduction histidine kinase